MSLGLQGKKLAVKSRRNPAGSRSLKIFTCRGGSWSPNRPTNSRSTSVRPRAKARTRRPRLAMRLAACSSTYASFWSSGWLEPLALYCLHRGKISSIAPFVYCNETPVSLWRSCTDMNLRSELNGTWKINNSISLLKLSRFLVSRFFPSMSYMFSPRFLRAETLIENLHFFEITRTIYSNSERSEQFLVTQCFFNLFLEVSHM